MTTDWNFKPHAILLRKRGVGRERVCEECRDESENSWVQGRIESESEF
jgi:hypothetical protein